MKTINLPKILRSVSQTSTFTHSMKGLTNVAKNLFTTRAGLVALSISVAVGAMSYTAVSSASPAGKYLRNTRLNPTLVSSPFHGIAQAVGLRGRGPLPTEWNVAGHMAVPRSGAAVAKLPDGRILIAGGETEGGVTNTVEIFDPLSGLSQLLDSTMSVARAYASVTVLRNGSVLIAGGENAEGLLASAEVFDPAGGSFSVVPGRMAVARSRHTATLLPGGSVLILGGRGSEGALDSEEIFDTGFQQFSYLEAKLNSKREGHTATLLAGGTLMVAGGNDGSGDLDNIEISGRDSVTFVVTETKLGKTRSGAAAQYLDDNGSVIFAGGIVNGQVSEAADLYDSDLNAFQATGRLQVRRSTPGSALVAESQAMIFGGRNESGGQLDTIESYFFATIRTDKKGYLPGETVKLNGSGWMPGEVVSIRINTGSSIQKKGTFRVTVVADDSGSVTDEEFVVPGRGQGRDVRNQNVTDQDYFVSAIGDSSHQNAKAGFRGGPHIAGAITYRSRVGSGLWSSAGTWEDNRNDPSQTTLFTNSVDTPGTNAGNFVIIRGGAIITMDATPAASIATLSVGDVAAGQTGSLQIGDGAAMFAAKTLTITGNVTIAAGSGFAVTQGGGAGTNSVLIGGSLSNAGSLDFSSGTNKCNTTFTGTGNFFIQNGATAAVKAAFNNIILTLGTAASTLTASASNFSLATAGLDLTGTGVFINNQSAGITPFGGATTIGANAGFRNSATAGTVNYGAAGNLTATGELTIAGGTFFAGTSGGATGRLLVNAATSFLTVSGGILNVAAGIDATAGNTAISGGTVNLGSDAGFTGGKPLNITGGTVSITGSPTINVIRPGTAGGADADAVTVTGGSAWSATSTLVFPGGNSATDTFRLNASFSLGNLTINDPVNSDTVRLLTNNLTLLGNLTVTAGSYDPTTAPLNTTLAGNYSNAVAQDYSGAANVFTFNSSTAAQSITGVGGTLSFRTLTISNTNGAPNNTVNITKPITVATTLNINNGVFDNGPNQVTGGTTDFNITAGNTYRLGGTGSQAPGTGTNSLPVFAGTTTINATSTVIFEGAAQTVGARTYGNLTLDTSSVAAITKTGSGTTNVAGNFVNNKANVTYTGTTNLAITGNATNPGTLQATTLISVGGFLNNTGTVGGSVALATLTLNGGTASNTNTGTISNVTTMNIGDNNADQFSNTSTGSITAATIVVTAGTSGGFTNSGTVNSATATNLAAGGLVTNNLSYTTGNLGAGGNGTFTQNNGSTLNISGTVTLGTLNASAATNTVNYNGAGAQTVFSPTAGTYNNLTLSNANVKSIPALTVTGDLLVQNAATGTLTASTLAITGSLTLANTAVFNTGDFTVTVGATTSVPSGTQLNAGASMMTLKDVSIGGTVVATTATIGVSGSWSGAGGSFTIGTSTVNFNGAAAQALTLNPNTDSFNNVNFSGAGTKPITGTMTVNGAFTNTSTVTGATTIFFNGAGSSNAGTLSAGTLSVADTRTFTNNLTATATADVAGLGTFTQGNAAATLTLGGNVSITNLKASAASGGTAGNTVIYNGAAAQNVRATSYSKLQIGDGASATNASTTGGLTVEQLFTVSANATFNAGTFTHAFQGGITANGTFNGNSATINITGTLTNTGTYSSTTGTLTVSNGITNTSGTFTNNGTISITGGNLSSAATFNGGSGSITVSAGNVSITGGTFTSTSGNLSVSGDFTRSGGTFVNNGGTVTFTGGGAHALSASTFFNLVITGTVTLGADEQVDNQLTISTGSSLVITGRTLTINGLISYADGTASINGGGTGNITFGGAGASTFLNAVTNGLNNLTINRAAGIQTGGQTIGGTLFLTNGALTFTNTFLILNGGVTTIGGSLIGGGSAQINIGTTGGGGITLPSVTLAFLQLDRSAGLTLGGAITVTNTLTFVNGKIFTGGNTLILGNTATVSGASSARYVVGFLQKGFAAAGSFTFDIGSDSTNYTPAAVTFTGAGFVAGNLTASTTAGSIASTPAGSGINPAKNVNRSWNLTAAGGLAGTYNGTFTFVAGDIDGGATTANFVVRKRTGGGGGTWAAAGSNGAANALNTTGNGFSGFSDFAVGEPAVATYSVATGASTVGVNFSSTVTPKDIFGSSITFDGATQVAMTGTANIQFDGVAGDGTYTTTDADTKVTPASGNTSVVFKTRATATTVNSNITATTGGATGTSANFTPAKGTAAFSGVSGSASIVFGQTLGIRTGTFADTSGTLPLLVPTSTITVAVASATASAGTADSVTGAFSIGAFATAPLSVAGSPYTITYSAPADANFNAPASNTATNLTVTTASTSTVVVLQTGNNPNIVGDTGVAWQATVTNTAGGGSTGAPNGTVQFKVDGVSYGQPITLTGATATTSTATSSPINTTLTAGTHSITAFYVPANTNFSASNNTNSPFSQITNESGAAVVTVTSSESPSVFNESVTFTATVTGVPFTPTGTVTFKEGATTLAGPVTLSNGVATSGALNPGNVGTHTITVNYSGDGNYNPASGTVNQIVSKANTSVSVASSAPGGSTFGSAVTFTATITNTSAVGTTPAPTGSVSFSIDGGAGVAGAFTLGAPGSPSTATLTTTATQLNVAGSPHSVVATYTNADGNFVTGTSGSLAGGQVVGKAPPAFSGLTGATTIVFGQSPTVFGGTILGNGAAPSGNVVVTVNGVGTNGAITAGTGVFNASINTSAIPVPGSPYTVTFSYAGDANFNAATNGTSSLTVNKSNTTTTVASSPNPSVPGQPVVFTATVAAAGLGSGTPTGTVTFTVDTVADASTVALVGGVATRPSTSTLSVGNHTVTATYNGDSNFIASTSANFTQTVGGDSFITIEQNVRIGTSGTKVVFIFDSTPGAGRAYAVIRCDQGLILTGTGTVTAVGGKVSIRDKQTDRTIFASAATAGAPRPGQASISIQQAGLRLAIKLIDANVLDSFGQCGN